MADENNPVMNTDPEGTFLLSLLIAAAIGSVAAAVGSAVTQALTTGDVDWRDVGVSAAFGAVGGALAATGLGGVAGQFVLQGALSVAETYAVAAVHDEVSDVTFGEVATSFLVGGTLGAIGSKGAAKEFKRVDQIERSFTKYAKRDIVKKGISAVGSALKRGAKYNKDFIQPTFFEDLWSEAISAATSISFNYLQKLYESMGW